MTRNGTHGSHSGGGHDPHPAHPSTGGGHDPHLAHHFDTPQQQFESGKLGMWVFLATEILLFGGLFCAYAVYRANHPEIFLYAHQFLDKKLGGLNTIILICSSFTMAWAVRAAQLGDRKKLVTLLAATLLFAAGFLGVKGIEYEHKWKHGLLWGTRYRPEVTSTYQQQPPPLPGTLSPAASQDKSALPPSAVEPGGLVAEPSRIGGGRAAGGAGVQDAGGSHGARDAAGSRDAPDAVSHDARNGAASHRPHDPHDGSVPVPKNVQTFFGIYFVMTGLHGLHVIAGMIVITIMMIRATRNEFGPMHFTPVDNAGLYWHVVDLIWIYLFPLLYLIH